MKKTLLIMMVLTSLASCRKKYECECKNSFSTYSAGEVEGTKSQARRSCQDLSKGDTECNLK